MKLPKKIVLVLAALSCFCTLVNAKGPVLWNSIRLLSLKNDENHKNAKARILRSVDKLTGEENVHLTDKPTVFVDDPHYYVSLGIYWWPDPNNPDGPYIRKDGQINPETKDYDSPKLSKMVKRVKSFAVAYYLTDNPVYKDALVAQLDTWFLNPDTRMYPNFEYGQIHPGSNGNRGNAAGLIEAYRFNDVLEAIRLVDELSPIDRNTMDGMRKWFAEFGKWLKESEIGKAEKAAKNNHGIAYDVILLNISLFTGDMQTVKEITGYFLPERLEKQIQPDGSMPLELARTRAYHYVIFNLIHIMDFCIIQENIGNRYYQTNKKLIDSAFLWTIPYIGNPDRFEWKENFKEWPKEDLLLKAEILRFRRLKPSRNKAYNFADFEIDAFDSLNSAIK